MTFSKKSSESGATKLEVVAVFGIVFILAVIAVISYYLALNKRAAENILNKANQRAVTVSVQIQDGKQITLNEFKDNGDIFLGGEKINKSQFKLILSKQEEEVCQQIKQMAGSYSLIQGTNEDCTALYYNIDLKVKNSPICSISSYLQDNKCLPCALGSRECECKGSNPYADGKGGCCHYVPNYTDSSFTYSLDDACCGEGFDIAINNDCADSNRLYQR